MVDENLIQIIFLFQKNLNTFLAWLYDIDAFFFFNFHIKYNDIFC